MRQIAVIGSGQMGNGIAQVFAQQELNVQLVDVDAQALERAVSTITRNVDRLIDKGQVEGSKRDQILQSIRTSTDLEASVKNCDLIIEAVPEKLDLKQRIFVSLDQCAPPHCILASNTSSISITRIASMTRRPDQVIGMHFMNPVPIMRLVEVIRGYATSDETANKIMEVSRLLGKDPVEVNDYPGFISNRILMPMINEAIQSLFEGVAGVEEIDTVMRLGMAHPMGPLHLADFIGLDTCLSILRVLQDGFGNPKYAPSPLLVNMVTAGKLGVKTGEGFYRYTPGSKEKQVAPHFQKKQ
ncbi:MAG: 3-hydroxybutyryl-CoA dehydrogenase [Lewinellaceae bacterium]|nr:3-hydroxybutyryl-CoA dehydrogenase [Lewinellaceae bacterium]